MSGPQAVSFPPSNAELARWLNGRTVSSEQTSYRVIDANSQAVIFGATARTGSVMLPTELIHEWVAAWCNGVITETHAPREMRDLVAPASGWAKQLHSFETHLAAVVVAWAAEQVRRAANG